MIIPLGHRLLVKPDRVEEVDDHFASAKRAGIIIADNERKREQAAIDTGVVVSMGETVFKDFGTDPWCQVNDKVIFTRYGGKSIKDTDGTEYVIINDEDVVGKYAGETK